MYSIRSVSMNTETYLGKKTRSVSLRKTGWLKRCAPEEKRRRFVLGAMTSRRGRGVVLDVKASTVSL